MEAETPRTIAVDGTKDLLDSAISGQDAWLFNVGSRLRLCVSLSVRVYISVCVIPGEIR